MKIPFNPCRFSSLGHVEDPQELANGEVHFTNSTRESTQFKKAEEKDMRIQENRCVCVNTIPQHQVSQSKISVCVTRA